jgi:hypothetical protein
LYCAKFILQCGCLDWDYGDGGVLLVVLDLDSDLSRKVKEIDSLSEKREKRGFNLPSESKTKAIEKVR